MNDKKPDFLKYQLFLSLEEIAPGLKANWGKMTVQHMVEHLTDFFEISSGKIVYELLTPGDQLPQYKAFLLSDKEFRENTKAPLALIGSEPLPLRNPDIATSVILLKKSVDEFFRYFEDEKAASTLHPVFGWLNYEEWTRLHFKHVTHHLRQFGLKSYS